MLPTTFDIKRIDSKINSWTLGFYMILNYSTFFY